MRVKRPLPVEGQPPRITELWAWTVIDPLTDVEGILAAELPEGGAMPMVGATKQLLENYRPLAEEAVRAAGKPRPVLQLRRFVAG